MIIPKKTSMVFLASAIVLPLIKPHNKEVEACEMAQPEPSKAISTILSASILTERCISSPQLGLKPRSVAVASSKVCL